MNDDIKADELPNDEYEARQAYDDERYLADGEPTEDQIPYEPEPETPW